MKLNLANIIFDSIVDGPGLRNTVFVQGCSHHCPGCHNPETWSTSNNKLVEIDDLYQRLINHHNRSVTFSGGEPFEQAEALTKLATKLKEQQFNLWSYSGYTYEQILQDPQKNELLKTLDGLVDGPFILEEKSLNLLFRGSRNQRLIDVQASLKQNKVILFEDQSKQTEFKQTLYI